MLLNWPCQARAAAENKRLSSNLLSGAALVNESLGIIADALRSGDRDREADPPTPTPLPITLHAATTATAAPAPPAAASGETLSRQPTGNPQNGQATAHGAVAPSQSGAAGEAAGAAVVMAAASAVASGAMSGSGFDRPAGWPEEEPAGFRGGLLRDVDNG